MIWMAVYYSIQFTGTEQHIWAEEAKDYCADYKVVKSAGALEIITLVFSGIDLLIALMCIPKFAAAVELGKVTIKKNGTEIVVDSKKNIVKSLLKNPDFRNEILAAFQKDELTVLGKAKSRTEVINQIRKLVIENETSD